MKRAPIVTLLIAALVVIGSIGYREARTQCDARGGILVRTMTGTACVRGMP